MTATISQVRWAIDLRTADCGYSSWHRCCYSCCHCDGWTCRWTKAVMAKPLSSNSHWSSSSWARECGCDAHCLRYCEWAFLSSVESLGLRQWDFEDYRLVCWSPAMNLTLLSSASSVGLTLTLVSEMKIDKIIDSVWHPPHWTLMHSLSSDKWFSLSFVRRRMEINLWIWIKEDNTRVVSSLKSAHTTTEIVLWRVLLNLWLLYNFNASIEWFMKVSFHFNFFQELSNLWLRLLCHCARRRFINVALASSSSALRELSIVIAEESSSEFSLFWKIVFPF